MKYDNLRRAIHPTMYVPGQEVTREVEAVLDYDRYMKEFRVLLKNREQPAVVRVPPGGTLEQDDSATIIKEGNRPSNVPCGLAKS